VITGDRDLLVIKPFQNIKIFAVKAFLQTIETI